MSLMPFKQDTWPKASFSASFGARVTSQTGLADDLRRFPVFATQLRSTQAVNLAPKATRMPLKPFE